LPVTILPASNTPINTGPQRWEYTTIAVELRINSHMSDELLELSNNLGKEGWELVSTEIIDRSAIYLMMFFSRPLP